MHGCARPAIHDSVRLARRHQLSDYRSRTRPADNQQRSRGRTALSSVIFKNYYEALVLLGLADRRLATSVWKRALDLEACSAAALGVIGHRSPIPPPGTFVPVYWSPASADQIGGRQLRYSRPLRVSPATPTRSALVV